MNYTGHKNIPGVIHKIINEIPKHEHYYELFAGSGTVGQQLPFSKSKHYNDLNTQVLQTIGEPSGNTVIKTSVGAMELIQSLTKASTDTFIFLDPPYLHSCRHSNKLYKFEITENDHIQLLNALQSLKCNCMIIHPTCQLYEQLLQSWRSLQLKIRYHKKTSIEKLYMNYQKPEILQSYKYIGKDCWQRQAFKRKAQRFINKGLPINFPEATYLNHMIVPPELQL